MGWTCNSDREQVSHWYLVLLVWMPEKLSLKITISIQDDNINMNLREICFKDGERMELAQDRRQFRALILLVLKHLVLSQEA
jgi:hypothetical protein